MITKGSQNSEANRNSNGRLAIGPSLMSCCCRWRLGTLSSLAANSKMESVWPVLISDGEKRILSCWLQTVMIILPCQLDQICNHLGDMLLGLFPKNCELLILPDLLGMKELCPSEIRFPHYRMNSSHCRSLSAITTYICHCVCPSHIHVKEAPSISCLLWYGLSQPLYLSDPR